MFYFNMQINFNNNLNFTSILPYKVFIDGSECVSKQNIQHGMRELRKVITKIPENQAERNIINTFWRSMQEEFFPILVKNGTYKQAPGTHFPMMLESNGARFDSYIAIDNEAEILKQYGKKIGLQKRISNATLKNTDSEVENTVQKEAPKKIYSFEVKDAQKGFYWKFNQLINTQTNRTKDADGNPIMLIINMMHNGKYGRTTFKSWIENIEFKLVD